METDVLDDPDSRTNATHEFRRGSIRALWHSFWHFAPWPAVELQLAGDDDCVSVSVGSVEVAVLGWHDLDNAHFVLRLAGPEVGRGANLENRGEQRLTVY